MSCDAFRFPSALTTGTRKGALSATDAASAGTGASAGPRAAGLRRLAVPGTAADGCGIAGYEAVGSGVQLGTASHSATIKSLICCSDIGDILWVYPGSLITHWAGM